jgi:hypothetical protein
MQLRVNKKPPRRHRCLRPNPPNPSHRPSNRPPPDKHNTGGMADNYEADESAPTASALASSPLMRRMYSTGIPVPMEYRLPHDWHLSAAGYAVPPPPPDKHELHLLIEVRRAHMPPAGRRRRSGHRRAWSGATPSSRSTTSSGLASTALTRLAGQYTSRSAANDSAACAPTDTGGVGSFSIRFIWFWWPATLRAIPEAFRRRHHPRQPAGQVLRIAGEKGGAKLASTRAPRPSPPQ